MQKIATAFVSAKKAFSPALKDKTNPAFRSKYADLGACLEAVNDALLENGIAVYQETHDDATGVTVETVFLHESGETMRSGKFHVPAAKQDPQGYGSALTYARRYSLITACGISPEDDDGNAGTDAKRREAAQPPAADMSPKAIATRLTAGVKAGDAEGACDYLITLDDKPRDAIWALLDTATQNKLTAVWPKEPA
jgi:hypothetical protein